MRGKIGSPGVAVKRYQRKKIRRAFTRPILECGGLPPLFLPSTPLLLAEARSLRSAFVVAISQSVIPSAARNLLFARHSPPQSLRAHGSRVRDFCDCNCVNRRVCSRLGPLHGFPWGILRACRFRRLRFDVELRPGIELRRPPTLI